MIPKQENDPSKSEKWEPNSVANCKKMKRL